MTELERILKDTLTAMEREMGVTLENHETRLANQLDSLETQAQAMRELRLGFNRLQAEQQESARHLQRLSAIHANLEPLLSRLNALLNAG
jgi:hypothetical protein